MEKGTLVTMMAVGLVGAFIGQIEAPDSGMRSLPASARDSSSPSSTSSSS